MKPSDITPCAICKKLPLRDNVISFYRIEVEQLLLNPSAAQRHAGLALMLGNNRLAEVMGPDADDVIMAPFPARSVLVCIECTLQPIAQLIENLPDLEDAIADADAGQ